MKKFLAIFSALLLVAPPAFALDTWDIFLSGSPVGTLIVFTAPNDAITPEAWAWYEGDGYTTAYSGQDIPAFSENPIDWGFFDAGNYKGVVINNPETPGNSCQSATYQNCASENYPPGEGGELIGVWSVDFDGVDTLSNLTFTLISSGGFLVFPDTLATGAAANISDTLADPGVQKVMIATIGLIVLFWFLKNLAALFPGSKDKEVGRGVDSFGREFRVKRRGRKKYREYLDGKI